MEIDLIDTEIMHIAKTRPLDTVSDLKEIVLSKEQLELLLATVEDFNLFTGIQADTYGLNLLSVTMVLEKALDNEEEAPVTEEHPLFKAQRKVTE